MWSEHYLQQVNRNIGLLTEAEQEKLRCSCVAVCGVGGLGGIIAEILARVGVGSMVLLDHGTFEPSNLNRQIFSFDNTDGRYKTDVTEEFLRRINPEIRLRKYLQVSPENVDEFLEGVDVIALTVDDIRAILTLSRAARGKKMPLVEGWAMAYGNVRVFTDATPTLEEVYRLPTVGREVASLTDAECRELMIFSLMHMQKIEGLRDYYSEATLQRMMTKGEGTTLAPMVWLTSVLMANEVFKVILGWGDLALAPELRFYDAIKHRIPRASTE